MLETLIFVMMGGWVLFEILLIVRDRRYGRRSYAADRGTWILN